MSRDILNDLKAMTQNNKEKIVELDRLNDDELNNELSKSNEDELIELAVSARFLGKEDLSNKIENFIHKKYISKWADIQAEKYVSICEYLHGITDIDVLRKELTNFSSEDILFIRKAAKKKYPNEESFSEQISVQHHKNIVSKLAEFTKSFYSGKLDEFMESNSKTTISNIKEAIIINNLSEVIPEASKAIYEYYKKEKFTR